MLDAQLPAEDAPDLGGKLSPPVRSDHRWYAELATQVAMRVSSQVAAAMSLAGVASIQLVDLSIMVMMYDHPSADVGSGQTRSMFTWPNRRFLGTRMGCTVAAGCLVVLLL